MIRSLLFFQFFFLVTHSVTAEEIQYRTQQHIPYRQDVDGSPYASKRCQLDIYYPTNVKKFATVVWFHGGGLTSGNRYIPDALKNKGLAIIAVGYRLSPKAKVATILNDAAAAVAWAFNNINTYGGTPTLLFISGHSAGGYITSMLGLDDKLLGAHQVDSNSIAGLIPYSGHAITHFTARAEQGIADKQPIIDKLAPLFHVKSECPPMLLITGDRNLELLGRYEENAYFWRMMKVAGNTTTTLREIDGCNHSQMVNPAHPLLVDFVSRRTREINRNAK